jgi:hypothetical protein
MKSVKMIEEGAALLYDEIIRLVKGGRKMDLTDHVFGYVYFSRDDSVIETDILDLRVIGGTLYAFMNHAGSEMPFTEEEREAMLGRRAEKDLPGWYALDGGFFGLRIQTLLSIADALDHGQKED